MNLGKQVSNIFDRIKTIGREKRMREKIGVELVAEYLQLRMEVLSGKLSEAEYNRRLKSIRRRFDNATSDTKWEEFCEIGENDLLQQPAEEAINIKLQELNVPLRKIREELEEVKSERDKHYKSWQEANEKITHLSQSEQRHVLIRKQFLKTWTPSRMVEFFLFPTSDTFSKERAEFLEGLPGYAEWSNHKAKLAQESKRKAKEAELARKKEIEFRRSFKKKSLRILSQREPLPPELANNYNHLNLPEAVLTEFLIRKHFQQQEAKKKAVKA